CIGNRLTAPVAAAPASKLRRVGEEEIAVMFGLLVYKPALRLVNCDARPASNCKNDCSCAWAKRMSNYSDDTFGMNCAGTVLQQYIIESTRRLMTRCWGHVFRRDCRLGLRLAIEVTFARLAASGAKRPRCWLGLSAISLGHRRDETYYVGAAGARARGGEEYSQTDKKIT